MGLDCKWVVLRVPLPDTSKTVVSRSVAKADGVGAQEAIQIPSRKTTCFIEASCGLTFRPSSSLDTSLKYPVRLFQQIIEASALSDIQHLAFTRNVQVAQQLAALANDDRTD